MTIHPLRKGPNEKQFTDMVLKLAALHGWRTIHLRPALTRSGTWVTAVQGNGRGFPDLLLLKGSSLVVAELKVGRRKPTPEQSEWLRSFAQAGAEAYVWTPDTWDEIEAVLGGA